MKKIKIFLVLVLFSALITGLYVAASCSATATNPNCNVSCSVSPPPGGSSQCTSGPTSVRYIAYDAAGNVCDSIRCFCSATQPNLCLQILPTC